MSSASKIVIYLLRRDLRTADNPILNEVSRLYQQSQHPFTHFLPIYIFSADQVEVSGFLKDQSQESPYPEARSYVGGFWRCGPHRAKFLAESVWDLKKQLQDLESGLEIRVGRPQDVLREFLKSFKETSSDQTSESSAEISGIWVTAEEGTEEKKEEKELRSIAEESGIEFKLWQDEKYLIDECVIPLSFCFFESLHNQSISSAQLLRELPGSDFIGETLSIADQTKVAISRFGIPRIFLMSSPLFGRQLNRYETLQENVWLDQSGELYHHFQQRYRRRQTHLQFQKLLIR